MDMVRLTPTRGWGAVVAGVLAATSCAQVGSPSGGPKDEQPPKVVAASPAFEAVNATTQRVELVFNEYVKARNWRSQLLVSPPLEGNVELVEKGKTVELSWTEPLRDGTTYVFQFGDGIVDLTEGNPAENLVHAFSTGPDLDTLALSGQVVDGRDGSPKKGWRVLLFPASWPKDSVLLGAKPTYVGVTDKEGAFTVGHLPSRAFWVCALSDDNRNYRWDDGESVALAVEPHPAGLGRALRLRSGQTPTPESPYLAEARRDSSGFAQWTLTPPPLEGDAFEWLVDAGARPDAPAPDVQSAGIDGAKVFATGWSALADSLPWRMVWRRAPTWPDTAWRSDTLDVPRPRLGRSDPPVLRTKPQGKQLPHSKAVIGWSHPLFEVDTSRIRCTVDSTAWSLEILQWMPGQREVALMPSLGLWPAGSRVDVALLPGALTWATESLRDTVSLVWQVHALEELAEWQLSVGAVRCPGWVTVANAKRQLLARHSVSSDTTLVFSNLVPGAYMATWWGDTNGDGVWKDVDVERWSAPEAVQGLSAAEMRANWVVETQWTLDSLACGQPEVVRE